MSLLRGPTRQAWNSSKALSTRFSCSLVEGTDMACDRTYQAPVHVAVALSLAAIASHAAVAGFTLYEEFEPWAAAAGAYTTIGFTELPGDTILTDQYANIGVLFPTGQNFTVCCDSTGGFPIDGAGAYGIGDTFSDVPIVVAFDAPRYSVAYFFPGEIQIDLFLGGEQVFSSAGTILGGG